MLQESIHTCKETEKPWKTEKEIGRPTLIVNLYDIDRQTGSCQRGTWANRKGDRDRQNETEWDGETRVGRETEGEVTLFSC